MIDKETVHVVDQTNAPRSNRPSVLGGNFGVGPIVAQIGQNGLLTKLVVRFKTNSCLGYTISQQEKEKEEKEGEAKQEPHGKEKGVKRGEQENENSSSGGRGQNLNIAVL